MLESAFPHDEALRLAALHGLNILDTPPEERFDRLTRIAQHALGAPIALLSLVDSNRQWFKSCQGLDASETPRSISFCGHTILGDRIFVIPDALLDPRFADNPLVTGAPHIRFYAGAPLTLGDGMRVGTLCVIDSKPHQPSPDQLAVLGYLAQCASEELERGQQQRRTLEQALSQARYASIIASSDDAIISKTLEGTISTWNPAAARLFGYRAAEALGRPMAMLVPPECADDEQLILARIARGEHVEHFETVRVRKDGSLIEIAVNIFPITDDAGRTIGASSIMRDIGARKMAENELRQTRLLLDSIIEHIPTMIFLKRADDLRYELFNHAGESLLGYARGDLLGKNDYDFFPRERADFFTATDRKVLASTGVLEIPEEMIQTASGETRYVQTWKTALRNESGEPTHLLGMSIDISERKKSEEDIANISRLSQAIVDGAEHLIITTDMRGVIMSFNRAAEAKLGYRAEELVGKSSQAVFHDADEIALRARELTAAGMPVEAGFEVFVARARRQNRGDTQEWTYVRKDGSRFRVSLTVSALRDVHGKITAFLSIATDISERARAVQAQRENEVRLAAILDNVLDGIITISAVGMIESFNRAAEKIFGYQRIEVIGHNLKMLMPEPYHSEHDGYLYNFTTTGIKKIIGTGRQVVGRRKDGSTFPMDLAVSEMQLGIRRMFTGMVRDITERVKIERMKSEFISTVSHELRTPLTSIRGSLALLVGGVAGELPAQAKPLIDIAHKNSERLILLVNDILDMEKIEAGKMEFDMQPVRLTQLLKQALDGNRAYAEQFKVSYELKGGLL